MMFDLTNKTISIAGGAGYLGFNHVRLSFCIMATYVLLILILKSNLQNLLSKKFQSNIFSTNLDIKNENSIICVNKTHTL